MPKSQKPRKKHNKYKPKSLPVNEHLHCPAKVNFLTEGPHYAELYCLLHQKHIQWLPKELAHLMDDALKTSPGISSQG